MKTIRLVLFFFALRVRNSLADQRDAAEEGHALLAAGLGVLDQAAEHDRAAVLDQHVGVDRALVGDQVDRAAAGAGEARALLLDLQHHRVALVDLRRDLQDRADFLALDGLERVDRCRCCCRRCWCTGR